MWAASSKSSWKAIKKGWILKFMKKHNCSFNSIRIPYLQFYLLHAPTKVEGGGGANPWYFHLSYKVKKSASCQKSGEGEAAPLTPTPDDTCLWCKHIVCSGVFAWSQRTRQLIGAQNYEWDIMARNPTITVHATNELIHWQKIHGEGVRWIFWHLFCNS